MSTAHEPRGRIRLDLTTYQASAVRAVLEAYGDRVGRTSSELRVAIDRVARKLADQLPREIGR
jgi:hypothetical protein